MSDAARDRLAFLGAWLPYAVLVRAFTFVTDDAYISFRYARHLAEGHGLRYNLAETPPVEGYSNFLWVLACAVVERLHGSIAVWAPLLSFVAGSVLLYRVYRVLRSTGADPLVAMASCWLLGLFAPFFVWSTSGLETMPFALFVFLAYERLALRGDGAAPRSAAAFGLAAALIRVEGVAWAVLAGLAAAAERAWSGRREARPVVTYFALVLAGFGAFLVWRHAYHGAWVANTATAKVGMSAELLGRGAEYVAALLLTFVTPLLLVPVALGLAAGPRRAAAVPVALLACAAPGYAIAVGGDFMAMGRLVVPGLAFAALLAGWAVTDLAARRRGLAIGTALGMAALGLLPAADVHLVPESVRQRFHVRRHWNKYWSEIEYWNVMRFNAERWKRLAVALAEHADPGDAVVAPGIGNLGYWSGLTILDQAGLVDRDVARHPSTGPTAPGHDRMVGAEFFLDRRPRWIAPQLVDEGPELERARASLEDEARRLRDVAGASYEVRDFPAFPGGDGPPRGPVDAADAVRVNLLGSRAGTARAGGAPAAPREHVLVLERASP